MSAGLISDGGIVKKLWKIGTAIFVAQLFAYIAVDAFLNKGNVEMAKIAEALVATGIAIAAVLLMAVRDNAEERTDHPTVFLLALAAAIIQLPRGLVPGVAVDNIVVLGAFFCLLIAVWRERLENESIIGCYAVAVPGIGVPIGGTILFCRWLRRRHHVSAA